MSQQIPIRLLVVTRERGSDKRYGLGKSLAPVVAGLSARGHYVHYLSQEDAGIRGWTWLRRIHSHLAPALRKILRGTESDALLWGILERFNMGRLAAKVARIENITHVHCHDPIIAFGFYWLWLSWSPRPKFGITEHGFGSYAQALHEDGARLGAHAMRFLRKREAGILSRSDWVSSPTQSSLDQLIRDLSLPAIPSHWHAIPPSRPDIPNIDRALARERLGISDTSILIISVGRLAPLKDFPCLIDAFARLCSHLPSLPLKLLILGDGDAGPLISQATNLGIADRLEVQVTDDIWPYYVAADLYVSTSRTESFGLANLEAVASGVASICSSVGGVPEVVGGSCRLVPAKTPFALLDALSELIADPRTRAALGARGQERMRLWPGVDPVVEYWLKVYHGTAHQASRLINYPDFPLLCTPEADLQSLDADIPIFQPLEPLELPEGLRVLVLAPHADDEIIGCGGTLAALIEKGAKVTVVVVTDGALGDPLGFCNGDVIAVRRAEAKRAIASLRISDIVFLDLPDGGLRGEERLESAIEMELASHQPDWLFLPSLADAHGDHVAVAAVAHRLRASTIPSTRYFEYEIWTPIKANRLVDVSNHFNAKRQALQHYALPLRYVDYLAGAEGLARYRGLHLAEGRGLAEAFLEYSLKGPKGVVNGG